MATLLACRHCGCDRYQVKNGSSPTGVARYKCGECKRTYAKQSKARGYPATLRLLAVRMYVDGTNFRRIARTLEVNPQSVVNWVNAYHHKAIQNHDQVHDFPHENNAKDALTTQATDEKNQAASLGTLEGDELFTFVGSKKNALT